MSFLTILKQNNFKTTIKTSKYISWKWEILKTPSIQHYLKKYNLNQNHIKTYRNK